MDTENGTGFGSLEWAEGQVDPDLLGNALAKMLSCVLPSAKNWNMTWW